MDKGGTQTNGPKDMKIDNYAQGPTHEGWHKTDYMCQEKKEEDDSPALRIVPMHQYEDSKTTLKRAKKD